jgi:hypothetical protein
MKEATKTCTHPNNFTEIRDSKTITEPTNIVQKGRAIKTQWEKGPTTFGIPAIPSYA